MIKADLSTFEIKKNGKAIIGSLPVGIVPFSNVNLDGISIWYIISQIV